MARRALRLARGGLALLALGLGYAVFCFLTKWALPCPFRLATGLSCPGCGVTRMCLALLRLDFSAAWRANPGLLALSPLLLGTAAWRAADYVRTGRRMPSQGQSAAIWTLAALLLISGGVRTLNPI